LEDRSRLLAVGPGAWESVRPKLPKRLKSVAALPQRKLDSEQFLVEAADLTFSVDEVNLQDPMPLLTMLIEGTHREVAVRMNVERYLVVGDLLVKPASQNASPPSSCSSAVQLGEGRHQRRVQDEHHTTGRKLLCAPCLSFDP
jgi:hypothetical protein